MHEKSILRGPLKTFINPGDARMDRLRFLLYSQI
jgi:hypothetical protein